MRFCLTDFICNYILSAAYHPILSYAEKLAGAVDLCVLDAQHPQENMRSSKVPELAASRWGLAIALEAPVSPSAVQEL